jgi:hypothetical protein
MAAFERCSSPSLLADEISDQVRQWISETRVEDTDVDVPTEPGDRRQALDLFPGIAAARLNGFSHGRSSASVVEPLDSRWSLAVPHPQNARERVGSLWRTRKVGRLAADQAPGRPRTSQRDDRRTIVCHRRSTGTVARGGRLPGPRRPYEQDSLAVDQGSAGMHDQPGLAADDQRRER